MKGANEEQDPDFNTSDKSNTRLMGNNGAPARTEDQNAVRTGASAAGKTKLPTPTAVSAEAVQELDKINKRPLRTSNGAPVPADDPK